MRIYTKVVEQVAEKVDMEGDYQAQSPQGLNRLRKNSEWKAKGQNLGDTKPSNKPRESFLGHSGAIHFSRFLRNRVFPQPLKPSSICGSYGTTKVVPLRVFADSQSFSAACKAQLILGHSSARLKSRPYAPCPSRAFSAAWEQVAEEVVQRVAKGEKTIPRRLKPGSIHGSYRHD
ncbi:MAG TPA: hypothetical protein VG225_08800 [Terracidiphilus sp.]|jgi:hypothetical protein|nr:hypothetical protein [Terracidiphilus sp.]